MEREATGPGYKMKGHTLPGINQKSAFQQQVFGQPPIVDPMAQGNPITEGVGAMGGVGAGLGLTPPIVSKPSMAKIYNKSELTKKVLK